MSLSFDDKEWIKFTIRREASSAAKTVTYMMPRSLIHTLTTAVAGLMVAGLAMDIKNKNIAHISYPLAEIERFMVEAAGRLSIWTGGFMVDYNRMYPSLSFQQTIIGLTDVQASQFAKAMRIRESSDNYRIINAFGYVGAYSMGAVALADIGYIDINQYKHASQAVKEGLNKAEHLGFLKNKKNWAKYSYEEFMNSSHIQDRAFIELSNLNIKRGFKNGVLKRGDHQRLAGFAAASHLVGYSNALKYYGINIDSNDRYGSTASEYAKLGEASIKGAPPIDVNGRPNGLPIEIKHYTRVSSHFGLRRLNGVKNKHTGIDFPASVGTPVKATADGKILFAGDFKGACGYGVKIQHGEHYATVFCHLSRVNARKNQWVRRGVIIGLSGGKRGEKGAGSSRGPHVHYAVKLNQKFVDPELFIPELKPNPFSLYPPLARTSHPQGWQQ